MSELMSLLVAVPLGLILLLFFGVFAAAGAGLVIGAVGYFVRAILDRDYGSIFGVITLGFVIAMFGWVIMIGSYEAGSMIIDDFITRISQ